MYSLWHRKPSFSPISMSPRHTALFLRKHSGLRTWYPTWCKTWPDPLVTRFIIKVALFSRGCIPLYPLFQSMFHPRPPLPQSAGDSTICCAKSSAHPTTPAASTAAGTTWPSLQAKKTSWWFHIVRGWHSTQDPLIIWYDQISSRGLVTIWICWAATEGFKAVCDPE